MLAYRGGRIALKVKKQVLSKMPTAYAPCILPIEEQQVLVMAPVDHGDCLAFFPPYTKAQVVWPDAGTMNIVAHPTEKNTIFSTRKFYPGFQAAESYVCRGSYCAGERPCWSQEKVLEIPYLHRFNIVSVSGKQFFIGCSLSDHKSDAADWSTPGSIYAAEVEPAGTPWKVKKLYTGIHKNHGYFHTSIEGVPTSLISGVEGVFQVQMTGTDPEEWPIRKIFDHEVSDIALFDIDRDGQEELVTIEGFHGDHIYVYKPTESGWRQVYHHEAPHAHVVWGGQLLGKPSLLISHTGEAREIFRLTMQEGASDFAMTKETVDSGIGANNLTVFRQEGKEFIFAANWYIGESALYELSNEN